MLDDASGRDDRANERKPGQYRAKIKPDMSGDRMANLSAARTAAVKRVSVSTSNNEVAK